MAAFLAERRGRRVNMDTFPEAVLNATQLDLFALYKEVVLRGGFKVRDRLREDETQEERIPGRV